MISSSLRATALAAFTTAVAVAVAGTVVGAAPAVASPVSATVAPSPAGSAGSGTVFGDFNGDGFRDSVSLRQTTGTDGKVVCLADLKLGSSSGTGYASWIRLPVRGANNRSSPTCPTIAQAVGTPGADQLAVSGGAGWPSYLGPTTQVFDLTTGATAGYAGGFSGQNNPPTPIGITDFDGDGYDDFYQQGSDQGEGVDLFLRRGDTWSRFYGSGYTPRASATVLDLDHSLGTDAIISTQSNGINKPFVTVVDGLTARTQNLVTGDYYGDPGVLGYQVAVVDIDGDSYPDLAVTPVTDGGTPVTRYFVNRSQNGKWKFVETRQRPVTT